jgi:hypothetical protein
MVSFNLQQTRHHINVDSREGLIYSPLLLCYEKHSTD